MAVLFSEWKFMVRNMLHYAHILRTAVIPLYSSKHEIPVGCWVCSDIQCTGRYVLMHRHLILPYDFARFSPMGLHLQNVYTRLKCCLSLSPIISARSPLAALQMESIGKRWGEVGFDQYALWWFVGNSSDHARNKSVCMLWFVVKIFLLLRIRAWACSMINVQLKWACHWQEVPSNVQHTY